MSVRVLTSTLLGVLADLVQTADGGREAGPLGAVLLHTTRGHHGAEPGALELLAGVSSDRHTAGHTYAPCAGQLVEPTLWSLRDVRAVMSVFAAARGRDPKNSHAVEIHRSAGEITIREDPNLIDEGVSLSFGELDAGEYPARSLYRILDTQQRTRIPAPGTPPGGPLEWLYATPRTDLAGARLRGFLTVARRRGELLQVYRTHQHVPVLVQIGGTYRGVLLPWRPAEVAGDEQRPDAELYPPDLDHPRWSPEAEQTDEQRPAEWRQLRLADDPPADP